MLGSVVLSPVGASSPSVLTGFFAPTGPGSFGAPAFIMLISGAAP
jgi:hypothetical protein